MGVVNLYNGIFRVLANDEEVLNYLGIDNSMTESQKDLWKSHSIQKRSKPKDLKKNIPLIAFYAPPGGRDSQNDAVYTTPFIFDTYTEGDVDKAHKIAQRIIDIFDGDILSMMGVESFESLFLTGHESDTDIPDGYCFTVVIRFSVTLH